MKVKDLDHYRQLGRAEGHRLAKLIAKEFLANPDLDVKAFEATRVRAIIGRLKDMLKMGESVEAVEAYGEACSDAFSNGLRERIQTARIMTKGLSS